MYQLIGNLVGALLHNGSSLFWIIVAVVVVVVIYNWMKKKANE